MNCHWLRIVKKWTTDENGIIDVRQVEEKEIVKRNKLFDLIVKNRPCIRRLLLLQRSPVCTISTRNGTLPFISSLLFSSLWLEFSFCRLWCCETIERRLNIANWVSDNFNLSYSMPRSDSMVQITSEFVSFYVVLSFLFLVLDFEPNNLTARDFYPLIEGKLRRKYYR